ncbi:RDD family protein [Acinetobacter equi]|uniref:RDD family protein n=1 Tax=Acinetobacter equi TaxID=1324350 RepID=A0A0N7GY33_9GAMM|nr:RDD family protein [Acinetobacter equi]ALH96395.1 RDD family protein [Acinetobacter equi]
MQIYLARNNQQAGPYTLEQLNQMLASQQVLLTDLVWHQGMTEWKALGELTQGQFVYQPNIPSSPSEPAPPFNTPNNNQNSTYKAQSTQNRSTDTQAELASLGSRFAAKVIDLLLWLPAFVIPSFFFQAEQQKQLIELQQKLQSATTSNQVEQLQSQLFGMIPMEAYQAMGIYIFIMLIIQAVIISKTGQSIGKRLLKIKIVDAETQAPVSLLRAFTIRSVLFIFLNALLFPFITFLDFAFGLSKKRQTLHDKLAKTIIIKK